MTLELQIDRLDSPRAVLLRDLALRVAPGTVHSVMGPSGSGKSSLLAAICGTLAEGMRFAGLIRLGGERIDNLPIERRRVGILFQDDLLFAHMTVRENLLFALPAGAPAAREQQVAQGLQDVEMAQFAAADPATLSGGQRARVALMRALLAQPRALLLDEPFSRLDPGLRERMRLLVFSLVQQRRIPVLLVTHEAADIADPALVTHVGGPR